MISLSGLWLQKTKDGKQYMAGTLGGARVLIFKNDKKTSPNQPDYNLFLAENKPNPKAQPQEEQQRRPVKNYAPQKNAVADSMPDFDDEKIPF